MAEAQDFFGTAFKGGSAILLARVIGRSGVPLVRADVAAAKYGVFLLDDSDPDRQTPVAGHVDVPLAAADVLDVLRTGPLWTRDAVGYNFQHALDVTAHPAFAIAGRNYRVVYTLVPTAGQPILVRFRVHAI